MNPNLRRVWNPRSVQLWLRDIPRLQRSHPYRLRADDIIQYENQRCTVTRVSDCAVVIAVKKPAKEFTTLFGVKVRIQPKPALVRISSNSECPILSRIGAVS